MTVDETIGQKMKKDLSLTERINLYIPGYRGYREKNLRREEDRAVRNEVAKAIQGAKVDLGSVQRELVSQPELMMDVERLRTKVDRYDVMVRKAVNGYSSFHTAVKITEADLDALVKWDAQLIDDIELMREACSDLLKSVDLGADTKAEIRNLERGVDSMIEAYNQRESVMRGFAGSEE